jgi:kinesin family protein 2/24
MAVSWSPTPGVCSALALLKDDVQLAVVLCPADAVPATMEDALGSVVNPEDASDATSSRYLCALMTPGLRVKAYELNLWRQIVIPVGSMEKEVILEYDAGTRYYYISA